MERNRSIWIAGLALIIGACAPMRLYKLEGRAEAVCNDGTPAGYYLRTGGANRWVVVLAGGGFCNDEASCAARDPALRSSSRWAGTMAGGGILSTDQGKNPDFHDANHVFVPYCSSDLWSGDRGAGAATFGWHFRGARIVAAVFDDLVARDQLKPGATILFGGLSAGGLGVLSNLDRVAAQLSGVGAVVKGIDDAGWLVDIAPYDPGRPTLGQSAAAGFALWGGRVDDSCASDFAGSEWRCYFGADVYPRLERPLFASMQQHDFIILGTYLGYPILLGPRHEYVQCRFAPALRGSLAAVPAALSLASADHGLLTAPLYWDRTSAGHSLQSLLVAWFFERGGAVKWIDPPAAGVVCP